MRQHNMTRRVFSLFLVIMLMLSALVVTTGTDSQAKGKIRLKKSQVDLHVGETSKIILKNVPKKAKVIYKADYPDVAKVSKKGVVKALRSGFTAIIITVKQKKKTIKKLYYSVTVLLDEEPYEPIVSQKFTGDKNAQLPDNFVSQVRDFSVNLFKACGTTDIKDGKNVLISPQSVLTDMMMAANGAGTTTLSEMEKVMCGDVGFEDFRQSLSNMNAGLIYSDPVRFHIANSIWVRDEEDRIKVKQDFIDAGEKYYNAESYQLPFDDAMAAKVNEWVNEHTFGMIPKLMDGAPSKEDVMHLINALAFEAAWQEVYSDYQVAENQTFTNAKGEKEKATMLNDSMKFYLHDDKALGFTRAYQGGAFSLVTILPNKDVGVEKYLETLDGKSFQAFYNSADEEAEVYTKLPAFTYDYDTELNDGLMAMGINEAFLMNADFKGMADTKSGALYIGKVKHKTHIELDKNGTKAAAVTDIGMNDTTSVEPKPLKKVDIFLDRPFIYAIVQTKTGIPIFMGVVNSVK